jgi:glycosyltransferase involved in cell wall biosynthesis
LRFIVIQVAAPPYRTKFFNYLFNNISSLAIISGANHYPKSVLTDKKNDKLIRVKNRFIFVKWGLLIVQFLPFYKCLRAKKIIIEFNPRILTNWLILLTRKILFKKTFLWGHAWARSGRNSKSEPIRYLMKYMSSGIIVYTYQQQKELQAQMPKKMILFASNALYHYDEMIPLKVPFEDCLNFIYVGRLVKDKKPAIMIEAFAIATQKLPTECKLIVIGDGPERESLEQFTKNHYLEERIIFKGHVSDYEILREYYAKSIASLSPGYLGLSVTQSLGFGVPIIVSKNESHSPEIEALIENENYSYFDTDNLESLTNMYIKFYTDKQEWFKKRDAISHKCRNSYSIEKMAEPFLNVFSD